MTKILFVCHGNICRSPMAEFIMKDLVQKAGLAGEFEIASAATSCEELGNPVYPPARRKLREHGIDCSGKTARRLEKGDYARFDYLICMDRYNLRGMERILGDDRQHKIYLLLSFTGEQRDIADPWYTGNFDETYRDVLAGCSALLAQLRRGRS